MYISKYIFGKPHSYVINIVLLKTFEMGRLEFENIVGYTVFFCFLFFLLLDGNSALVIATAVGGVFVAAISVIVMFSCFCGLYRKKRSVLKYLFTLSMIHFALIRLISDMNE